MTSVHVAPPSVRDVDQPVVGARPDAVSRPERRRDRVDDAALRGLGLVGASRYMPTLAGHVPASSRQVGTDLPSSSGRRPSSSRARSRRSRGCADRPARRGPAACAARDILRPAATAGAIVLRLVRCAGRTGSACRRRRCPDRAGRARRSRTPRRPTGCQSRNVICPSSPRLCDAAEPLFLLPAAHAVGKRVVGAHVVELRRRLVVPGAPGVAAVDGDDRALVAGEQHDRRVVGVDPDAVVVVAARRAAERR